VHAALISDFYDHPHLYDALLPANTHVPFYVDLARQQPGAVLELACGTGQLTIPIALAGLPTVGFDRSSAMLNGAKVRASAAGASVEFVEGDMKDFALASHRDILLQGMLSTPLPKSQCPQAIDGTTSTCFTSESVRKACFNSEVRWPGLFHQRRALATVFEKTSLCFLCGLLSSVARTWTGSGVTAREV
jgi:SAM-dependent methyltransferase